MCPAIYSHQLEGHSHEFFKGKKSISRGVVELEDELAAKLSTECTVQGGGIHAAQPNLEVRQGEALLIDS